MRKIALLLAALMAASLSIAQSPDTEAAMLEKKIESDTTDWKSMYSLAKIYKEQFNTMSTLKYIEMALKVHESDTLKRELAQCCYQRGYYTRCAEICKSLLMPDTLEKDLMLLTRSMRKEMPQIDLGDLVFFQITLFKKNPVNQDNTQNLAQNLMSMKMAESALRYLDIYHEADSSSLVINTLRAKALLLNNKTKESIAEYEKLIETGCKNAENYYFLGTAYCKLNDFGKGIEALRIASGLTGDSNPQILNKLGLAMLKTPETASEGVITMNKAVEEMQPDPEKLYSIYVSIGDYYEQINSYKAIEYYQKARECSSKDPSIAYRLANCYRKLKNNKKEAEYLNKFLVLSNDSLANAAVRNRLERINNDMFMNGEMN